MPSTDNCIESSENCTETTITYVSAGDRIPLGFHRKLSRLLEGPPKESIEVDHIVVSNGKRKQNNRKIKHRKKTNSDIIQPRLFAKLTKGDRQNGQNVDDDATYAKKRWISKSKILTNGDSSQEYKTPMTSGNLPSMKNQSKTWDHGKDMSKRRTSVEPMDSESNLVQMKRPSRAGSMSSEDTVANSEAANAMSVWNQFESHLKSIHDDTDYFSKQAHKTFRSSDTFKMAMSELYGNSQYRIVKLKDRVRNAGRMASKLSRVMKSSVTEDEVPLEVVDEPIVGDACEEHVAAENRKEEMHRGWRLLKRNINEAKMENNTSSVAMGWAVIHHHAKNISDSERVRLDLYHRYGILPTMLKDGSVTFVNSMLSEKAQSLQEQHGNGAIKRFLPKQIKSIRPKTSHLLEDKNQLNGANPSSSTKERPFTAWA